MISFTKSIETVCEYLFLFPIIEHMCPRVKKFWIKVLAGLCLRLVLFIVANAATDAIWDYDCQFDFGCDQYNSIMDAIHPFKSIIQFVSARAVDVFNFLMKESDLDEAKRERNEVKRQLIELQNTVYGHALTIPDDYHHTDIIICIDPVVPEINIHDEFESFTGVTHLHHE